LAKAETKSSKSTRSGSRKSASKKKVSGKRIFFRRAVKYLAYLTIVLIILPLALSLLYRIESVHPVSTLMLSRYATLNPVERQWKNLEEIAPVLVQSVIMSEDGQFCFHRGVDWAALNSVIDEALEGEKARGASTLTMQTAKNLFLWTSRSYLRKGLELPLALWLDLVLSKKRIMEIYLNIAEWDTGVFGVEAASRTYFKKSASRLTRRQASLLTVTLPNPRGRNAAKPSRRMNKVAKIVERRAKRSGAYVKCVK